MPAGDERTVVVALGCRPLWSPEGRLFGALGRRVEVARTGLRGDKSLIVVTGGRTWEGVVEADAMRDELVRAGVAEARVVRERCALTTRDNASLTGKLAGRLGFLRVTLVTCEWHMPRAAALFRQEGLVVDELPARGPDVARATRWYRRAHEWVARVSLVSGEPS